MLRSHALLAALFDYTGFFPPASLDVEAAMASYARLLGGRYGWTLGRLVVPATRLEACSARAATYFPRGDDAVSWRLSAIGGRDPEADAAHVSAFNRLHADAAHGAAIVDTVEVRVETPEDVRAARVWASRGLEVYCEVSAGPLMERLLDAVARAGLHAKLRAGGAGADSVPDADDVAAFLCGCVMRGVVAKATSGLQHAISGAYAPTADDSAPVRMFGFVNLVLGAGVAEGAGRAAAQSDEVRATVAHVLRLPTRPTWVGHASMEWRDGAGPILEGPLEPFAVSGRALIRSIGVASLEDPLEDARHLGLLA